MVGGSGPGGRAPGSGGHALDRMEEFLRERLPQGEETEKFLRQYLPQGGTAKHQDDTEEEDTTKPDGDHRGGVPD